ncbi:MAG TPA: methyltransferase [Saprospiraceae bacterium]|nr:methyltransferase [Saprospiraceae bacterium]HMP14181.1 methyltransferase [Saprospiraceae bacterium]
MGTSIAKPFLFKQFAIHQDRCTMKVGTDGVLLGAWVDVSGVGTALDIGAGSGVIAIMLGQRASEAHIHAVEIEREAFDQAQANMRQAPWSDRLAIFHTAIQDYAAQHSGKYDLIVSNPPFFSGGTFSHQADRNSVRHTVKLPHGDLLAAVRTLLHAEGRFGVVLPYIEGLRFQELARSYKLYASRILEVRPKQEKPVERLLMQFEKQERQPQLEELVIQHDSPNEWTEAYRALTGAFYLYM